MGLCPLHTDHKPSFLVDPHKEFVLLCYGCGRGGDVIRFVESLPSGEISASSGTMLREWCGVTPLINAAIDFYRLQLHRHNEPLAYLDQRGLRSPEVIEHMRIGYAAGGGLQRGWLYAVGISTLCPMHCWPDQEGWLRQLSIRRIIIPPGKQSLWPQYS